MKDFFDKLQFNLFEIIGYIIPGLIFIAGVSFLTPWDEFQIHLGILIIGGYVLGNVFHTFNDTFTKKMWKFYHKRKDKGKNNRGLQKPKTKWGKTALFIRKFLLDTTSSETLSKVADKSICEKYKIKGDDKLATFYIKEVFLSKDSELHGKYEYLHYQKIFSQTLSVVFFTLASLLTIHKLLFSTYLYMRKVRFEISVIQTLLTSFALLVLAYTFYKRGLFFSTYRKDVLSASLLINNDNLNNKQK